MYAYYAHWKKDYKTEAKSCQYGVLHYLEGMLNITTRLAKAYVIQGQYKDAAKTIETMLAVIECIFRGEDILPPLHHRENVDLYIMLADIYLKDGDRDKAIEYLEKAVDYDINEYKKIDDKVQTHSPLLNSIPHGLYRKRVDRQQSLIAKLTNKCFDSLANEEQYKNILERIKL